MRGIVLFGHGSRDPLWRQPMDAVAERVARHSPDAVVRCAFLELQQPNLASAVRELVAGGVERISIVPMFLAAGRHARQDLPRLVDELRRAYPALDIVLQPPVGEDARTLDLLAVIAAE